jgi:hypothetical protein
MISEKDYKAAHKYRLGDGWCVIVWDDHHNMWREIGIYNYHTACRIVADTRKGKRNEN